MALIILIEKVNAELSYQDIINLFTLSKNRKDFGRYILYPSNDLVVIYGNPTNVKDWKDQYFFARGFIELDNGDHSKRFLPQT